MTVALAIESLFFLKLLAAGSLLHFLPSPLTVLGQTPQLALELVLSIVLFPFALQEAALPALKVLLHLPPLALEGLVSLVLLPAGAPGIVVKSLDGRIGEDIVGNLQQVELFDDFRVAGILVGMVFERGFTVGTADVCLAGLKGDAEKLVEVVRRGGVLLEIVVWHGGGGRHGVAWCGVVWCGVLRCAVRDSSRRRRTMVRWYDEQETREKSLHSTVIIDWSFGRKAQLVQLAQSSSERLVGSAYTANTTSFSPMMRVASLLTVRLSDCLTA